MKISCVIPTYNSAKTLAMGLEALSLQQLSDGVELEVIVVDDGSTDKTATTVESFRKVVPNLHYVFRPRDEFANRSRTRNLGLAQASGDMICFLDAGVIVPTDFIQLTAARLADQPKLVLVHETLGLNIDPDFEDTSVLEGFTVDQLDAYMPRIKKLMNWSDPRGMSSQIIQNNMSLMPAPWTEVWSSALTVPLSLIEMAGRFDEDFYGWGVEDIEFAYRLYHAGAIFRFERKAYAFHYPHPISRSAAKEQSLRENMSKMNRTHYQLDTECHLPYLGLHYQAFLEKMNHLELSEVLLPVPLVPSQSGKVLAIGFDRAESIRTLGASHAFAHNHQVRRELSEQFPKVEINYLLGVDTPYEDHAFEIVYLSDVVRVLHPFITQLIFKEVKRIGQRAVWIHSESDQSPFPVVDSELSKRLKDISRSTIRNNIALFDQEYVPSWRNRFIMEKKYWTSKDEIKSLAVHEKLALECIPCHEPSNQTQSWRVGT
jgi:glycosyltransferase involved in cell wall biosynthesis